ncbi:class I SAM-dependent methyltransferase [Gammaproteobacteria bacterium]|nr:class I SAM-dependent methyltransferase [Gammaproteobacteria bacterium]
MILKRPIKADIIDKNINYQVKGKSTRFDIYI